MNDTSLLRGAMPIEQDTFRLPLPILARIRRQYFGLGVRLVRRAVAETRKGNSIGVVSGGRVITEIDGEWSTLTSA